MWCMRAQVYLELGVLKLEGIVGDLCEKAGR